MMSTRGWSASHRLQNCIESLLRPYKSHLGNISQRHLQQEGMAKRHGFPMQQGLRLISTNIGLWRNLDAGITKDERGKSGPPPGSAPPKFNFSLWAKCFLGSVLSFSLHFWKEKWAKLMRIEGEAEMVVEEVENAAEVVEKVATAAEKLSAQVADKLPDDSVLKKAALVVEHVSEETAQDAHVTTEFIHQVEALKHDVDGLESWVEPIVNKILKPKQGGQGN
ncbi:uncharacterized protein LOC110422424 [Herrania umbratica]|uniref:Uncharacterized protein LOC110422424 n=1 Tax=Herrania umbratica TaxID=108875 RepID=A0A6J1AYD6_9ROSI|nr:uncharacterized protein LOC110422424 [Herrania umbratica]